MYKTLYMYMYAHVCNLCCCPLVCIYVRVYTYTGTSSFAFVEFYEAKDAARWMEKLTVWNDIHVDMHVYVHVHVYMCMYTYMYTYITLTTIVTLPPCIPFLLPSNDLPSSSSYHIYGHIFACTCTVYTYTQLLTFLSSLVKAVPLFLCGSQVDVDYSRTQKDQWRDRHQDNRDWVCFKVHVIVHVIYIATYYA